MNKRNIPAALLSVLSLFFCSNNGIALTLSGVVLTRDGQPLPGSQLTLTREDGLYAETVYTNSAGKFRLATEQSGYSQLRARHINYADFNQTIELARSDKNDLVFKLRELKTPREISDNLTASAHFTKLKFRNEKERYFFKVDCLTCHQLGNPSTRIQRPRERWLEITHRMLGYWGMQSDKWAGIYADILHEGFDGALLNIRQEESIDPMIYDAHITSWKLPEGNIAHDVEYHHGDGKFYTVDMGNDQIYITDPDTNQTEVFRIPGGDIPIGGKFKTLFNMPAPLGLQVRRGPHSLQEGPDGKFYTTDTISGQIGVFDPVNRTYVGYDIGGNAMYPHTLRFDKKGLVWFTLAVSNQVGRFDPVSKKMTVIELPPTKDREEFPMHNPYGIDIHPVDGSIWYSRLSANRIGRIDPDTLEVTEITPDFVGPRRMRFAKDGTLWIPAYGDGTLEKLDTRTMKFSSYPIPTLSAGEKEAPYALGVHPETQEVWITANMSDRMFRFLPKEERFVVYPMPTKGIFLRDIIFTPDGQVCAASNTVLPAINLEGGMEEVVCVAPDRYKGS